MTMLGRGKKKAAKENAQEAEEAVEAVETEEVEPEDDVLEPEAESEGTDEDGSDDASTEAQNKLILAKAELAKAEAELAKARLAEAEAELARAEKAAKAREKDKARPYKVRTVETKPAAKPEEDELPREPMSQSRLTMIVGVLGAVCVLLAATAIFLMVKKNDQDAREAAGRDALTAAAAAAQDFSSYDYRSLDSNFKTAANEATGEWLKQYRALSDQIRTTAAQSQVVVVGTVLKTGLEQVSPDRVVAVVFLNQQTAKAGQDKGYDQYRLRMTLEKHGGRWLVANLQAL